MTTSATPLRVIKVAFWLAPRISGDILPEINSLTASISAKLG